MTATRWAAAWVLLINTALLATLWALVPAASRPAIAAAVGGTLLATGAAGLALLLGGLALLQRWAWRPAAALLAQVQALGEWRFEARPQPPHPEWVPLARALNVLTEKVRQSLQERDTAVGDLRSQLARDELTHAASRQHFMWSLERQLQTRDAVGGIAIVRVNDLEGLNQRLGRHRTDELLVAVATTLRAELLSRMEPGQFVLARLNGADFGLLVPGKPLAEWAQMLHRLATKLAALATDGLTDHTVTAWIGGTSLAHGEAASQVLARVDAQVMRAIGRAEPLAVADTDTDAVQRFTQVAQWRQVIETALDTGHLALAQAPEPAGQGLCSQVHVSLVLILPDGGRIPRDEAMPAAVRCGRSAELDLKAVEMALQLLQVADHTVSLELQPQSLDRPTFVRRLRELLLAHPVRSQRLTLELTDLADTSTLVRALQALSDVASVGGCALGLRNFGIGRSTLPLLAAHGLRHARLSAQLQAQAPRDPQAASFVQLLREWGQRSGVAIVDEAAATPA